MLGALYKLGDALRRRSDPGNSGRLGEDLAHRYLRRAGCTITARNYRPPGGHGEIDVVAWDAGTLVFVEVKTRATRDFGAPESAVDRDKQAHVRRAARDYARRAKAPWNQVRFDIVSVVLDPPSIEWLRDAWR